MKWRSIACLTLLLYAGFAASAQPPAIVRKGNGGYALMVDGRPYLVLGAQLWNSSNWPHILDKTWPQLKALHCNTLEAPVYWQHIEPSPGKYNFAELDQLISGARREGLRLILLWFGSYKNGSSQYAPEWVLTRPEQYPRMLNGGGEELLLLSAVSPANLEADKRAFAALMRHLKQTDGQHHTVIMVQVENEAGSLGTDRDYSEAANALFNAPVPASLLQKLGKPGGSWPSVFGAAAAETFNAYHIASYINEVALAGRREYELPLYANAWLREHGFRRPGEYPSGGPTSNMLDIWKAAAPALSLLAPDIYQGSYEAFTSLCEKYSRPDNPLFVPEMGKGPDFARYQFYALGNFNALGVAPYGIDPFHADPHDERDKEKLDNKFSHIADNYRLLQGALGKIAELQHSGRLKAAGEEYGAKEQLVSLNDYDILCSFGFPTYRPNKPFTGRVLIGQLDTDEFLVLGFDTKLQFRPRQGSGYHSAEFIRVEEGYYRNGQWVMKRLWNGDEVYHFTLLPEGTILKVKLRKTRKAAGGKMKANFEQ